MADELSMALMELLRKAEMDQDVDFLREGIRTLSQALMELEVSQHLGAERHERTPERTGQRNGYRERQWDTRVGTIPLRVPRVRDGSYFPALLEPRRRAERALVAVIQEAYVQGVSTRRVDEVVQALGMQGISKSQVSRLCQELDAEVERFRLRRLTKHMSKRKARKLSGAGQLDRMRGQVGEEPTGRSGQLLNAARQPICGYGPLHQPPDAFDRVHLVGGVLGQPEDVDTRMGGQPFPDHLGGMRGRVIQRQVQRTRGVGCRQALQKGDKVDGQLAFMIGREPLPAHGIQGPKEGAPPVGPRGRDAATWAFHPHGTDEGQEMQVRLVQVEQVGQPLPGLLGGLNQRGSFGLRCWVGLAGRSQPGSGPAPAHLVQVPPDRSTGESQAKALGQEGSEQRDTPAGLDVSRARRRLTGLGIDDGSSQRVLGRAPATGFIFQPSHPLLLIAMQPGAHDVLATGMDGSDLGNGEATIGEQHHVGAQSYAPDGLPTDGVQFVPLALCQMNVNHLVDLLLSQAAKFMPNF
jgi:hypothetical protein